MARSAPITLALPPFAGATRRLVLWNLAGFFVLALLGWIAPRFLILLLDHFSLQPSALVLRGEVWQLVSYSFINLEIFSTAFALLTLWFVGSLLESERGGRWLLELYFFSVAGAALLASALSFTHLLMLSPGQIAIGPYSAIFGLLIAVAILMGEQEFLLFFVVRLKAKYMVAIFILLDLASLLKDAQPFNVLLHLAGALSGYIFLRAVPRRGLASGITERYFAMRNAYYRSRRRRAARKFEVYMKKQNREVHFDRDGRYIDPEHSDSKGDSGSRWMN